MSSVTKCDRCFQIVLVARSIVKRSARMSSGAVTIDREWELCQSCHEDFEAFINPKVAQPPRNAGPG